ncbi:unnamed protein product [Rotaria sordida]|uniref:3CxxC-type domain-containing protein n=1 Tax=Rotaria sordida TaxID=392033 RepID=A0A815JF15_9BILA|nr:unnamed protein product [Rotaria sordida]CAF1378261.1 unnamed protein product [Rotaria sordida]
MQQFQTYPLSSISISKKNKQFHIVDDNNNNKNDYSDSMSRFTSNDSGISYDNSDDDDDDDRESFFSNECNSECFYPNDPPTITITDDAHRAAVIRDDDKKYFCENTAWAWHGEFGRLIMATAMTYNIDYRLMLYDARLTCPRALNASYSMMRLENAKAQFKCDICGHCWTSMRARCSFYISKPNEGGIVLLRLYTQQCQYCYSIVHPLWYFDEICRVMKNLALTIFKYFFPNSLSSIYWDITHNGTQPVRRLFQRKGNMHTQHNSILCEACHLGLCYL